MAEATHNFPRGFLWGAATAGYQVEGESTGADYWEWEQQARAVEGGQRSGRACDWWAGRRWQEDFDRAAADGHSALRLSVEWSRVEPAQGRWDEDALDHYRQMVQGLRQRGLSPMVTLHHVASPAWAANAERNVWETGEVVLFFERFARKVVTALGDQVDLWCTINEPNVFMFRGWMEGVLPPRKKNFRLAAVVGAHILRAHAAAYRAIHALQPGALVGLPIHFRPTLPAHPGFALDEWAAQTQFNLFSAAFSDAIATGRLRRPLAWPVAVPEARGTQDYIALQYYTSDVVRFDLSNPGELFGRRSFPAGAEPDQAGFYASYPPGFFDALRWAHHLRLPIYVTENGIGDAQDGLRRRFLLAHLRQLWRAANFNWDVRGYFHWTLVDNFEWERGWAHRFGLYALDPETQVRTPRESARLFAEIARSNSISSEMVDRYAPALKAQMFPG
jgi:beta-glucosidase